MFGDKEYEFRNANEFNSYIEKLDREGKLYELLYLFNSYKKALKEISSKVWPSDTYNNLVKKVASIIRFGDRLFKDDIAFYHFLENLIASNEHTPINLKYFAIEHKSSLDKLKSMGSLSTDLISLIRRIEEYKNLEEIDYASITIDGVMYPSLMSAQKGEYRVFGNYPQDNNATKEPMEWLVLDVTELEILLISRYVIDIRQYHNAKASITWEKCDLRKWLNNDFLKMAFSQREQKIIKKSGITTVYPRKSIQTKDSVFCLSVEEYRKYFNNYDGKTGLSREKAGYCTWWLRSQGQNQSFAAYVNADGKLDLKGIGVEGTCTVRPAIWLKLNS